ncbi:MAG: ASCH domain-containing protein [Acidimicrobiaceae bacterium]|nr:ASCH domain-containing protein [Acidimicrobiaceae bacterium]
MTTEVPRLDPERMVVLSLKPRFAEAILAGDKTVELRRTVPKIVVPTLALLYATTPVRALLGTCVITSVRSAGLAVLWSGDGSMSDLGYHEFQQYFEGVDVGTALTLIQPCAFSQRIPLRDLRAKPKGFRPPQSLAYVDTKTGDQLMRMAA